MATTATEILARVQAYGYGSDTEASQLLMLNECHKRIMNYRRWRFQISHEELATCTAGTNEYTLAETKRVDALRLEFNSETLLMQHMDYQELRDNQAYETQRARPEYWTQAGGKIILWPTPDLAYKIIGDVLKAVTSITTGATAVQVPDDFSEILVWGTIAAIAFRERDWDSHNFARQMYQEHLAEMASQWGMTNRQTSSRVVNSGWYDRYDIEDEVWQP